MPAFNDSPFRFVASLAMTLMKEVPNLCEDEAILFAAQAYQRTGNLISRLEESSDEIKVVIRHIQSGYIGPVGTPDSV
jgi:hypothetical protein